MNGGRVVTRSIATAAVVGALITGNAPRATAQDQVSFEQMLVDLGSPNAPIRFRAVQALKQAAYPEGAVPLARTVTDPEDAVQLEAIAAELNIFLADKIEPRKRVGLIVEVRNKISAPAIFAQGEAALEPTPVPTEVLTALRAASHDNNPRVSVEALYALGALSGNVYGPERRALLSSSSAELAAVLGVQQVELRGAALQVIARMYEWRPDADPIDQALGDAVVGALNDRDSNIRAAALETIGRIRYERAVQAVADIYQHYGRGKSAGSALETLARIGHPSSFPLFMSGLAEGDAPVKLAAIDGLARSGDAAQADRIAQALASERNDELLLAGHYANAMLANGPVDAIVDALSRPRLHDRALQYLIDAAPGHVSLLGAQVQHPDARVRLDLLEVLGRSGDPQALAAVARAQQDPDPTVARAAARAAARLQGAAPRRP